MGDSLTIVVCMHDGATMARRVPVLWQENKTPA
jgi:hypothetical protein